MNNKLFIITLVAIFAFAGVVSAEWKSFENSRGPQDLKVRVLSSTPQEIKVEITVPGYHMNKVMADGKECVMVHIPGSSYLMEQGFPMVPKMAKLVKVHDRCDVKIKVLSKEEVDVKLPAPIIPSKGHLTRDINPDSVAFEFGPIYSEDTYWPAEKEQFSIGKPFNFREVKGVRIQVLPVLANHVKMSMKVLKKAVVVLVCEHDGLYMAPSRMSVKHGKNFKKLYRDAFLNYEATESEASPSEGIRATVPDQNNKKLVVVTPKTLESAITEWVAWKKKSGYTVTVYTVDSGVTASTIKAYLQKLYDDVTTRFGYVVLIGDAGYTSNFETAQPMPTFKGKMEGAAADRVYVRLAGNDNYPDAFVSRISDTTVDGIKLQLAKIVAYESNPPTGAWLTKGICIASDQGSPTDKERTEWIQNGGGTGQKVPVTAGGLMKYGYTYFDDIYDPYATQAKVGAAVNEGRSVIFYIGHGSSTSWVSSGFAVSNVDALTNGGMLPVIWSVACVNGDFVRVAKCFGEAWLRKSNGGAAAMECASTNEAWVPPCDKQAGTINAIIGKTHFTFGALEAIGLLKGMEAWGDGDSTQGNQLAEQCNLFGDCSMLVRTKAPQAINVTLARGLDNNITFQVTSEGRGEGEATVTVYTEDLSFVATGDADENGNVNISLEGMPANAKLLYTVVGPDLAPEVDKLVE